ncbi:MAG TPA: PspC domain-containing protein [Oscillospiraceae bacterium]|nr:PspC domain-containing protein [Oscillospiraceae bacterium]
MEPKKLVRSRTKRMFAGICGGVADYTNLDPTIIRALWVVFGLMAGAGLLAYIILLFVIPEEE